MKPQLTKIVFKSTIVKITSVLIIPIIIGVNYILISKLYFSINSNVVLVLTLGILALLLTNVVILIFLLKTPVKITATDSSVVLNKLYGTLKINYSDISSIEPFYGGLGIRKCGSGGFMGFIGKFYCKRYGSYTAYIGDPKQAFMITTKQNKKFALSCEDREELVEYVRSYIK